MRYYPAFIRLDGEKVVFSGASDHAAAKIKLLLKTNADIHVFGDDVCGDVRGWAEEGKISLHERVLAEANAEGARLVYGANDDPTLDAQAMKWGKRAGALTNIVDNLEDSDFLTPAIVDRDPVTVAIGTEGTAPVLARKIKAQVEALLPPTTGILAKLGNGFRPVAAKLRTATQRRDFWTRFFFAEGPKVLAENGEPGVQKRLRQLYAETRLGAKKQGSVALIGTGPGNPELLTLKARRMLHEADVVLHDRLVTPEILELARREATVISVGKKGYGLSWKQSDINALLIEHARKGARIARLKSGDPAIFGRLDEEIDVLDAAGIEWEVIPGITAASAAAASIGASLTRRGRNSELRILTAREVEGFAEQDWTVLAQPGATVAIYMGVRAVKFLAGRLLMHGAAADKPVTIVENASRIDQRVIASSIGQVIEDVGAASIDGPAIIFLGLTPRKLRNVQLANIGTENSRTGTEG